MYKIIFLFAFLNQIQSDCLSTEALQSLGFTKIKTTPEKIDNSAYCKGIYKNFGTCVDLDELKTIVDKKKAEIDT